MLRRVVPVLLALGLTVSACSGDPGPERSSAPRDEATSEATTPPASPTPANQPTPAERLGLVTGWGPSRAELERAARLVGRMPLPDLAGQVIVAEWGGTAAPVAMVRQLHLGGVIAFSDNVASTGQIRSVNATLDRDVRRRWPLFLSVDQEGGIVERVKGDATRFPTFMSAGAAGDPRVTTAAYRASAAELRGLGFDVVFAPVADVTSGPDDPTIGSRSAGSDAAAVGEQVSAAVDGIEQAAVVPVLKHFPGHGSVPQDSHLTLPVQTRTRRQLAAVDLAPFAAAVEAGVPAVMVGHIDVRSIDPRVPSSMSRKVVTGVLREQLGFEGLAVTDSLSMAGVQKEYDAARSAVQGLRAGNDVLLMPPSPAAARAGIVRSVRAGQLPRRRLEQAAARMVAVLLHSEGTPAQRRGRPPGSGRAASRALSAAAVTSVAGECRGRLVGGSVTPVGDPVAVANFAAAAGAAGLEVLTRRAAPSVSTAAEDARLATGTSIAFSGFQDATYDGEVAVATDTPYVLGRVSAPVRLATYGDTPGAMAALVDVLLGRARAPGRLPVEVVGVQRDGC